MKTKRCNSLVLLMALAAALLFPAPIRADFVSDINNATTTYQVGSRVIYEMNVGMFTSQGTFSAAKDRLAELREDGIDVIWLMPIHERGSSGSPYAPKSYTATNPAYGTVADLKAFVTRAHQLGMKVWLDWVCNHMAVEAEWVTTHPEYFVWQNGQIVHPNNYQDVYQLNYGNSGLVTAMSDAMKFWIDQCGIDGYRCDYVSTPYIDPSYWQTAIATIKAYTNKEILYLGEAEFAAEQTRLNNVGFDYDYAWWYQSRLKEFGGGGTSASTLKNQTNTFVNASKNQTYGRMMFLTNHDQNFNDGGFTMEGFYGNNRYALTVLLYTIYGMPLVYNGQEIGGSQVLNYFSDTKINWSAVDWKMRNTVRTLAALKHSIPALRDATSGSATPAPNWVTVSGGNQDNVLAFTRKSGDSEVLVVLNLANSSSSVTLSGLTAGTWSRWLDSSTIASGTGRANVTFASSQQLTLESKGYRVYVKGSYSEEGSTTTEPQMSTSIPEQAVWVDGKYFAYFEAPASWSTVAVWAWDDNNNYTGGTWPGTVCEKVATLSNGYVVWRWQYTGNLSTPPEFIIFNNNNNAEQTGNLTFTNAGYYTADGNLLGTVTQSGSGGGSQTEDTPVTEMAAQATYVSGNFFAYFEAPESWGSSVNAWVWIEDGANLTGGTWPGQACEKIADLSNGHTLWRWVNSSGIAATPGFIIFNDGTTQTGNLAFTNGGYYSVDGLFGVVQNTGGGEQGGEETNITVYVRTTDSNLHIYGWNDSGTLTDGWPGSLVTQTATLYNETFLCHTFANAQSVNFILNCGDDNTKTADITGITADIFVEYSAANKSYRDITEEVTTGGGGSQTEDTPVTEMAAQATYVSGNFFAYFEAPESWGSAVNAWVWIEDGANLTGGTWPGQACEKIADLSNGHTLWRWVNSSGIADTPGFIIFNDGTTQTGNLEFTNGGYYSVDGLFGTVAAPEQPAAYEPEYIEDAFFAYFEAPSSWGSSINAWVWNDNQNFTGGTWPGQACEKVADLDNGNALWRWVNTSGITNTPTMIIFNDGTNQTADLAFTNGGYYKSNGLEYVVQPEIELPAEAIYVADNFFAYFEAPTSWGSSINAWVWSGTANYTGGTWPGQACEKVANLDNGNALWRWINTSGIADTPSMIIFNDGSKQTADLAFTNGGYYTVDGLWGVVTEPTAKLGDLTGDGDIDGSDVSALLELVLEGDLTDAQKAVADLTGDGDVDGSDISALLEMVLSGN